APPDDDSALRPAFRGAPTRFESGPACSRFQDRPGERANRGKNGFHVQISQPIASNEHRPCRRLAFSEIVRERSWEGLGECHFSAGERSRDRNAEQFTFKGKRAAEKPKIEEVL